MAKTIFIGLIAACLAFKAPAGMARITPAGDIGEDIATLLATENLHIDGVPILTRVSLEPVYRENGYQPYWTEPDRINELMNLIEESADHGLNPSDYNQALLGQIRGRMVGSGDARLTAEQDILLTESLFRYGYHRRYGKVRASSLDPDINYRRESFQSRPVEANFRRLLESGSLDLFIQRVAPSGPVYRHLQSVLAEYRGIERSGGWPVVPAGSTLRLGDVDPRVGLIRARLLVTGELDPTAVSTHDDEFDEALEQAVRKFQDGHALERDGLVGKQTLEAMNVPVSRRIEQLRLSLERIRWVNQEAADTLVAVNIAGFRAFFYRDGELAWTSRAMVGTHYRQTPVFRGEMTYLEFNPTWTIPPTILRNDTLPAIRKNPDYLESMGIDVLDSGGKVIDPDTVDWSRYTRSIPFTLRQEPGPKNALGMVKFIFPNPHFVFLHDTPHRELFRYPERAFSSGCIRIERPLDLAELVLDDPVRYPHSRLEAIVDSKKTERINLEEKIPVLIVYLTASVDPDGKVRFFRDIYSRDGKVLAALDGPVVIDLPEP